MKQNISKLVTAALLVITGIIACEKKLDRWIKIIQQLKVILKLQ